MPVRSSQEDFLLHELRKVGAMIARALGFHSRGDLAQARAEIENAYKTLLGPEAPLFRMLDVESVVRLVAHPKKLATLARLMAAEGTLTGDSRLFARATAFSKGAVDLDPTDDEAASIAAELTAGSG